MLEFFTTREKPLAASPLKLLVIEDDESLIEALDGVFSDKGYLYTAINNTDDILPLMEEVKPDLVLLDYLLPHINGGELCSQVKNSGPFNKTPVIIFSAFPKVLMSLGDYGCDVFLEKPFDLNYLIATIEKLATRSRRHRL